MKEGNKDPLQYTTQQRFCSGPSSIKSSHSTGLKHRLVVVKQIDPQPGNILVC